jgi:hypothetical protein
MTCCVVQLGLPGRLLACAAAVAWCVAPVRVGAGVLVDTGSATGPMAEALRVYNAGGQSYQNLAGRITVAYDLTLAAVEAWMTDVTAGLVNLAVCTDAGGSPGMVVAEREFAPPAMAGDGWVTFDGLGWDLPGGTYWLVFRPVEASSFDAYMKGGAASPLDAYAIQTSSIWFSPGPPYSGQGFRVLGDPQPVRFVFADGLPAKLVWPSEAGRIYDLWEADDLDGFTRVAGYPKAGVDGSMEHPFTPATQGFFRLDSAPAPP